MKYFDFHTHAFADFLAPRAMESLSASAKSPQTPDISPCTDGTLHGLKTHMERRGISECMILPIATKPSQQDSINKWAADIMGGGIYCCGSVHPNAEDALDELERIKSYGLIGVKFHSEYQKFRPDEERMMPIYQKISELGLIAVFHGGWDPFGEGDVRATPQSLANIAELFPNMTIVAAHMGGMMLFDDVERYIAGKFRNIYLDTGVVSNYIGDEQLLRIIKTHGADRILFASDSPWDDPANEIAMLNRLPLSEDELEMICFKNAETLIKVEN